VVTPSEFALGHDFSEADKVVTNLETPTALSLADFDRLVL